MLVLFCFVLSSSIGSLGVGIASQYDVHPNTISTKSVVVTKRVMNHDNQHRQPSVSLSPRKRRKRKPLAVKAFASRGDALPRTAGAHEGDGHHAAARAMMVSSGEIKHQTVLPDRAGKVHLGRTGGPGVGSALRAGNRSGLKTP